MPKVLIYYAKQAMWLFLFWNTDVYENRAHVHIGRKGTKRLCKIWLEPTVDIADKGDLSEAQLKEVLLLCKRFRDDLLKQWNLFRKGEALTIIKITK